MTAETRTFISPQEVLAVGFVCSHCKATFTIPINSSDRLAQVCPNCQQRWVSDTQTSSSSHSDLMVLRYFVDFVRELQRRDFGANLRLELSADAIQSDRQ